MVLSEARADTTNQHQKLLENCLRPARVYVSNRRTVFSIRNQAYTTTKPPRPEPGSAGSHLPIRQFQLQRQYGAKDVLCLVPSTMERRARARALMVRTDCAKFSSATMPSQLVRPRSSECQTHTTHSCSLPSLFDITVQNSVAALVNPGIRETYRIASHRHRRNRRQTSHHPTN